MTLLIFYITVIGYICLIFSEPTGFKRFNNSRDILLKSSSYGMVIAFFLVRYWTKGSWAEIETLLQTKNEVNSYEVVKVLYQSENFFWGWFWLVASQVILFILNKLFLNKATHWFFLSESNNVLYGFRKKFVLINVKPNKIYTGFLTALWDTDDVKGIDLIEFTPILVSYYDDKGSVHVARRYTDSKDIQNTKIQYKNSVLIKYEEVTQIRLYDNAIDERFERLKKSSSVTKFKRKKVVEKFNELKTKISNLESDNAPSQEDRDHIKNLIEKLNPANYIRIESDNNFLTTEEYNGLQNIPTILQDITKDNYETREKRSKYLLQAILLIISYDSTIEMEKLEPSIEELSQTIEESQEEVTTK